MTQKIWGVNRENVKIFQGVEGRAVSMGEGRFALCALRAA